MNTFSPIVYLNSGEQYLPSKIEDFGIDWSTVTFYNTSVYLDFSYKGPSSFDNTAPMLVSIYQESDGTLRITYIFFYAYNGCGPKASYYGKLTGLSDSGTINLCPADLHYGDIEHITMYLYSNYSTIQNITYAYHKWTKTYTQDGSSDGSISQYVTFSGNHPLVFSGLGSHASYSTSGDQLYDTIIDDKGTGYEVWVKFTDYPGSTSAGYKWTATKLLKLNGNAVSNITTDEENLAFKFYGAIGPQISNTAASNLLTFLEDCKKVADVLSLKSLKKDIESAIDQITGLYTATGVSALATGRSYW